MALSSVAATRVLYEQNFETATDPAATGWTTTVVGNGGTMSIASDEFGKFFEFALGQNNGRTATLNWGQNIFLNDEGTSVLEDGTYTVKYDFCIAKGSNNQYGGSISVFTNHTPVASQTYRNPWSPAGWWDSYLFDMSQTSTATEYVVNGGTKVTENEDGTKTYAIDFTGSQIFTEGAWYTVTLNTNVNDRTVEYSVASLDGEIVASGTRTVPETNVDESAISMFAEGIHMLAARYQTVIRVDNIVVSFESANDYSNDPTVALTRLGKNADDELDLAMRAYTISFRDGETLHVIGTDSKESTVDYADCEGAYIYETTTSGVLKAWTTCGNATSKVVETTVDCSPVALPTAVVTVSSVAEGYGKTYTLTVDNSEVPLRPSIFIDYEFVGKNGEKVSANGQASGCKVAVTEEGTLTVTTTAFGYQSTTSKTANDIQFEVKKVYDFARLTEDSIKKIGFPEFSILNTANTSGFNNWTGRKRLYYELAGSEHDNGEGTMVRDIVYPFGFIAEDNTENVIRYSVIANEAVTDVDMNGEGYFADLAVFPKGKSNKNLCIMEHIGIYNNQTNDNNNNIIVKNLGANDFVVVNYINNYGGNSIHPVCANNEEYFAQLRGDDAVYSVATQGTLDEATNTYSVTHPLYRVDTACTKITVLKQNGESAIVEIKANPIVDNGYYSLDGIRWEQPVRPGFYIHNGKKVIIK